MPHFIAEYTDNIEQAADLPGLFSKVHDYLGATGVFPLGGIRSRGVRLDTWRMADGKHDYAFVHMRLQVGAGRDLATRREVAEGLFDIIKAHFATLQAQRLLAQGQVLLDFTLHMAGLDQTVNAGTDRFGPLPP